jgi:hypothetical protein
MKITLVKKVNGDLTATYHEVVSDKNPVMIGTIPMNKKSLEKVFKKVPKKLVLTISKGEDV